MKLLSVCEAGFMRALAFSSSFDAIKPYENFCTFDVPWLYLKVFFLDVCQGKSYLTLEIGAYINFMKKIMSIFFEDVLAF
ncbi:hypothetical protein RIF29_25449 [Crotalaria pallida]|uniref:Uncharacterized protein n=1 Tax=Crotalaria pallida TaxID=3830 RepID=A0AAN9EMG7_CROPI